MASQMNFYKTFREKERNQRNPNLEGRSKAISVWDDMMLCIGNPKDATKNNRINKFSKVAE